MECPRCQRQLREWDAPVQAREAYLERCTAMVQPGFNRQWISHVRQRVSWLEPSPVRVGYGHQALQFGAEHVPGLEMYRVRCIATGLCGSPPQSAQHVQGRAVLEDLPVLAASGYLVLLQLFQAEQQFGAVRVQEPEVYRERCIATEQCGSPPQSAQHVRGRVVPEDLPVPAASGYRAPLLRLFQAGLVRQQEAYREPCTAMVQLGYSPQ